MIDELGAAVAAARAGGAVLRAGYGQRHERAVKGIIDFATEVDFAAERRIVELLQAAAPGYGFLTEEHTVAAGPQDVRWIVDPVDGTTNYSHGFPHFSVSVALERHGQVAVAAVYDPMSDEMYSAQCGAGAWCNGQPIHIGPVASLGQALLSTGYGYDAWTNDDDNLAESRFFIKHTLAVRCSGSAALDLAWVACGRSDGHWEKGIQPYDVAAGVLLVREAGGLVTDYAGRNEVLAGDSIIAANPALHEQMRVALTNLRA